MGTLELGYQLTPKPTGTYSIAGAQAKLVMVETPQLKCTAEGCDFTELAKRV